MIQRYTLLQNGEQIKKYNDFKKSVASLGEMIEKERRVLIFCCGSH